MGQRRVDQHLTAHGWQHRQIASLNAVIFGVGHQQVAVAVERHVGGIFEVARVVATATVALAAGGLPVRDVADRDAAEVAVGDEQPSGAIGSEAGKDPSVKLEVQGLATHHRPVRDVAEPDAIVFGDRNAINPRHRHGHWVKPAQGLAQDRAIQQIGRVADLDAAIEEIGDHDVAGPVEVHVGGCLERSRGTRKDRATERLAGHGFRIRHIADVERAPTTSEGCCHHQVAGMVDGHSGLLVDPNS